MTIEKQNTSKWIKIIQVEACLSTEKFELGEYRARKWCKQKGGPIPGLAVWAGGLISGPAL
jgi:hypothetical protein